MAEIKQNLVFLSKNLTNLSEILGHLVQHNVISDNESQEIENQITEFRRNGKLLSVLRKKDWEVIRNLFLEILRETNNEFCANVIEGSTDKKAIQFVPPKLLKDICWPGKKDLVKSLYKRILGDKLLIEDLHEKICAAENRTVVICEAMNASKLSGIGMGGIGKTLTANWYAHHYRNEYEHVIWIDCGEDSLITSFKKLARDLEVKNRSEFMDLEDYSRKSYEALKRWKCLWIYDNAENYKGSNGIQKILPKDKDNFYCLITSRNRKWGNENGYGGLCQFEINIFSDLESLEFLKNNLKVEYTEEKLKELCELLGNLPLALQLAIAALKNDKMDLQTYIEKSRFEKIVNYTFDDYEKTVNNNVRVTMELIAKEDSGDKAYEMIVIFAYIRPDDISTMFFQEVLKLEDEQLEEAFELLIKYSLVSQNDKTSIHGETEKFLNIHRLLQQVIRYIEKGKEKETLRKILSCSGFLDYKLIPFTKYASEELRSEFPKLRAELLEQEKLEKLLYEERYEESVQLARFIDTELQQHTTRFNYSVCLEKNLLLKESGRILEELYKGELPEETSCYGNLEIEMGILKLINRLTKDLVGGQLVILLWKTGNRKRLQEILRTRNTFWIIKSKESMNVSLQILNANICHSNYSLFWCNRFETMNLQLGGKLKEIEVENYSLDLSLLPQTVQKLSLREVEVLKTGEIELPCLKYLNIYRMHFSCLLHFVSCQLTHINFYEMLDLNVDFLPKTVIQVKIVDTVRLETTVIGGVRLLDKLTLDALPFLKLEELLSHFQPKQLVLWGFYKPNEVIEFLKKYIKLVAIGVNWDGDEEFENSILYQHVDRKSKYYLFEGGIGKAIEEKTFKEFELLDNTSGEDEILDNRFEVWDHQRELLDLLSENKFEESVHLSRYIDNELGRDATRFNHSLCLEKSGELEEAIKILEELNQKSLKEVDKADYSKGLLLLDPDEELSKVVVQGHLLILYWRIGNRGRVQEILEERKQFKIILSQESLKATLEILFSKIIDSNYSLQSDDYSAMELQLNVETKKIAFDKFFIFYPLPEDLEILSLKGELKLGIEQMSSDLSQWIPKSLKKLTIDCFIAIPALTIPKPCEVADYEPKAKHRISSHDSPFVSNFPVGNIIGHPIINAGQIIISLESISFVEDLDLSHCVLNGNSASKIFPKKLKLADVIFTSHEQRLLEVNINDFFNFKNINEIILICSEKEMNWSIDMSQEFVTIRHLELRRVKVLNWKQAKWNADKLILDEISFVEKSKMKIRELEIKNSSLDLSCLPSSIRKLSLRNIDVVVSGEVKLPNLRYLVLENKSSSLAHFRLIQLTHIHFRLVEQVNIDFLPLCINTIKMSYHDAMFIGGVRQLERLILEEYSLDKVGEVLSFLQPKELVVKKLYTPDEMIEMTKREIDIVVLGEIMWEEDNFYNSIFSDRLDRKSKYYVLKEGRGKGIQEQEFAEFLKL